MAEHRVRLDDRDIEIIVAALRARKAMARGERAQDIGRLIERLSEGGRGNPLWRFAAAPLDR